MGKAGEDDGGVDDAFGALAIGGGERDGGDDVVAAAGEEGEAGAHLGGVGGLGQDAAADGDDGVGGEHEMARCCGGAGFRVGDAAGVEAGELGLEGRLVDAGGGDAGGGDADLREEGEAAGAGGCEGEGGYLKRNVMRPFERS